MTIIARRLTAACLAVKMMMLALALSASADPALERGRKVFTELATPSCALCHALADAGATGAVGPSLDELRPDAARVKAAVTNGIGVMPPYENLSPEQIDAVALYVAGAVKSK
jgi:cytochrome c6